MNLAQANRLVTLANFLESLPETQWDYSLIREFKFGEKELDLNKRKVKVTCNTVACAIGWCPTIFPKQFKAELRTEINTSGENSLNVFLCHNNTDVNVQLNNGNIVGNFFGLSASDYYKLFLGSDSEKTYGNYELEFVTKKQVVERIYSLVKEAGYDVVTSK